MLEDHVRKCTWHNQMMTCVNRKLARAMSTCDVNKSCHSGRITLGVSPLVNEKNFEVLNDEVPKRTQDVQYERSLWEHSHP
jgi:hypothetical protein